MISIVLIIITLGILCYYYMGQSESKTGFTVYGTTWCGYTTKQREYLDKKYGRNSHKFIDCDKQNCPGISAFPVTEKPDGTKVKGFNETL